MFEPYQFPTIVRPQNHPKPSKTKLFEKAPWVRKTPYLMKWYPTIRRSHIETTVLVVPCDTLILPPFLEPNDPDQEKEQSHHWGFQAFAGKDSLQTGAQSTLWAAMSSELAKCFVAEFVAHNWQIGMYTFERIKLLLGLGTYFSSTYIWLLQSL